jgi:hypothetical protein
MCAPSEASLMPQHQLDLSDMELRALRRVVTASRLPERFYLLDALRRARPVEEQTLQLQTVRSWCSTPWRWLLARRAAVL